MKLALGSVQFGLPYGIANQEGQVTESEAKQILDYAKKSNINTIDTAIGYGDSEQCLGNIGVKGWNVITKLPEIPQDCIDVSSWINEQINASLNRLKVSCLKGVLLHRPMQLLDSIGEQIWKSLQELKQKKIVEKIGFSIYSPDELDQLWYYFKPDIVQAAYNVFDHRLRVSGWMQKLNKNGIEVHARSIFLQGLLLMKPENRPDKFDRWNVVWKNWDCWLKEQVIARLDACLRFVSSEEMISCVVIGVDTKKHFKEIVHSLSKEEEIKVPDLLAVHDEMLINPANW